MKRILLAVSMLMSFTAQSQSTDQANIERLEAKIRGNDYFAGKTVTIQGIGSQPVVIDRTAEAARVPVGARPPSVGDILGTLDAETRAHVKLDVDRDYFKPSEGGGVRHEHWHIDLGGAIQINPSGPDDKVKPVTAPETDQ